MCLALPLVLSACSDTGDFGRPRPGVWNDVILPITGSIAARERGEAVSDFPLTDRENELRDRAWRFVMPAAERSTFDTLLADYVRARVLPRSARPFDITAYYTALVDQPFASPASRFRRIGEDAEFDARLIGPFGAVAEEVLSADAARWKALHVAPGVAPAEAADARARILENRCLIAWVRQALDERTASYRYALDHGFIAMPQGEAVPAERAIRILSAQRVALAGLPVGPFLGGVCLALEPLPKPRKAVVVKG